MHSRIPLATLAIILSGLAVLGSQTRADDAASHVNFQRVFYSAGTDAAADEAALGAQLAALETLKGRLARSGATLLRALQLRTGISLTFEKLDAYFYLQNATDVSNTAAVEHERRLATDVNARLSFVASEIAAIPGATLTRLMRETRALAPYEYAISQMRRFNEHRSSVDVEATLAALQPQLMGWQDALYEQALAAVAFEPITVAGRPLDPYADRQVLASSSDATVRKLAFDRLYTGLAKNRSLMAFALQRLASSANARATLHRYPSAVDEFYAFRFLTRDDVQRTLDTVAAMRDLYKEIEQAKVDGLRRALRVPQVAYWDLLAPMPGVNEMFTLSEARTTLLAVLAPLGADYEREVRALLAPDNGRFDVSNERNRRAGGFSLGFPSFPSVFFAGRFGGRYEDLRTMTHESGHAIHRELMRSASIVPDYARGPNFLFESFASFNELLLADYLHDHATNNAERRFYTQQFIDGKATAAFYVAPEAELEQSVYDAVRRGGRLTPDVLDDMTATIYSKYSMWPAITPELRRQWQLVTLMYEDPFYDLNYVYAGLLALKYYERFEADRDGFRTAFVALLKNGFDAPPDRLLQRFLNIDLRAPSLADDGRRVLLSKLRQLRTESTD
jgi:oligoendopeptidase F